MPRFSVIIPAYRAAKYLDWAVASLENQTFRDWEAIIVDDGSECISMMEQIQSAVKRDERIRMIVLPANVGPAAARNRGLVAATGDYVAFLDSDDLLQPRALEIIDIVAGRNGDPEFIAGTAIPIGESEENVGFIDGKITYRIFDNFFDYRTKADPWWFSPSGVAIKRLELLKRGGFWDVRYYCEDLDLWLNLGDSKNFIRIDEPATYGYRLHSGSIHHHHLEMFRGIEKIINKEIQGGYPGGKKMRYKRIWIIAAQARHHALEFRKINTKLAWVLYCKTFRWNVQVYRIKFLTMFPILVVSEKTINFLRKFLLKSNF